LAYIFQSKEPTLNSHQDVTNINTAFLIQKQYNE